MNMYLKMYVIESVLSSVRRNNRSTGRTVRIYCTKSHRQKVTKTPFPIFLRLDKNF